MLATNQKINRYYKKIRLIYSKQGIKGLYNALSYKVKDYAIKIFYRNSYLRRLHHPKIKVAYLELTNKCNLRCKMCHYQEMQDKTGFMSRSFFESCVNQLIEIGLDTLTLHFGGESLVHPNFKNFLEFAIHQRNQGKIKQVGWTDNGMLFNQNIADLVLDLKVDAINFSIDGIGKINDEIRLGSKYSVIEKNIKYLLEKRRNRKKPKVSLNITGYGKTVEQKMDIYREWIPFVDQITLIPSILPDNTWEHKNKFLKMRSLSPPPKYCIYPFEIIAISWDGKVTGCCLDYAFRMVLGNATKEPIKQIWEGPKFQDLRRAVLSTSFPNDSPCYGCEYWQINFEPKEEIILNGKAKMEYGYIFRKIRKT